jgi:hypothetical protein
MQLVLIENNVISIISPSLLHVIHAEKEKQEHGMTSPIEAVRLHLLINIRELPCLTG